MIKINKKLTAPRLTFFLEGERERNPHNINYAFEFPTLEEIAEVSLS